MPNGVAACCATAAVPTPTQQPIEKFVSMDRDSCLPYERQKLTPGALMSAVSNVHLEALHGSSPPISSNAQNKAAIAYVALTGFIDRDLTTALQ